MLGDSAVRIQELDDESVAAVITDPPYEIGFMAKKWDRSGIAFSADLWTLIFSKLKPGGVIKVFSATRTYHRLAKVLEEVGFTNLKLEAWAYGSGFPKNLNISKQLAKSQDPASKQWLGYGTALKPAWEPFLTARKPETACT